ncbi:MAG: helix-turn-helix domain-containing protein [Candidatus Margulisbacteria bacterium]|jgi:transcriptional regulator with XRE-family HTH domain|nr:helix-turn-helix domain-containing protein [Candidatus Margulisiibacteriota bacterium]
MRIERGENSPTLDTLLKIIDGLDISAAEFFRNFKEH